MRRLFIGWMVWCSLSSCDSLFGKKEDPILAEVYDKKLHVSDVNVFLPKDASPEDSLLFTTTYVERWAKETIMLHEAEKRRPEKLNIEALLEAYRSSLIRQYYEEYLIENELDNTVSDEELREFYEKHKAQYELESPLVRAYVVKLPRSVNKPTAFNNWWENSRQDSSSFQQLKAFADTYAEEALLSDSTWYSLEDLREALPDNSLTDDNIRIKKDFTQRDDDYEYFYKNIAVINKKATAPFDYIEEQARRFIMQKRKHDLLQTRRQELFDEERNKRNIRIYVEN